MKERMNFGPVALSTLPFALAYSVSISTLNWLQITGMVSHGEIEATMAGPRFREGFVVVVVVTAILSITYLLWMTLMRTVVKRVGIVRIAISGATAGMLCAGLMRMSYPLFEVLPPPLGNLLWDLSIYVGVGTVGTLAACLFLPWQSESRLERLSLPK